MTDATEGKRGFAVYDDPFAVLGLPRARGLADDDVRAAWRRIAAATHPDRDDGGDPARFGAAGGAYATLRTSYGRGEALADLATDRAGSRQRRHARDGRGPRDERGARDGRHARDRRGALERQGLRGRRGLRDRHGLREVRGLRDGWGRPGRLALRAGAAGAASGVAIAAAGWAPASIGVLAGALTWLVLTGWHDVAPRELG